MSVVWLASRLALAAVFAVAGAAKLVDLDRSRRAVREFGVPQRLASPIGTLLPLGELAVGVALVGRSSARWGAVGALVLLGVFIAVIGRALAKGREPDCHCFGQLHSGPVGPATLVRNVVLAGVAALVVWHPAGGVSDVGLIGLAVAAAFIVQGWFCYQLLRQNGRILARLSEVEQSLVAPTASKLQVGSQAPYFSLPALDGSQVTLESLLAPDRPLLLAFVDPGCGPCAALLPQLAAWQHELADSLTLAVVSGGDAAENEAQAVNAGIGLMLLQPGNALSELYGIRGTPSAVLIDSQGQIAQPLATGAAAIPQLLPSSPSPALNVRSNGGAHDAGNHAQTRANGIAGSMAGVSTATAVKAAAAATLLAGLGAAAPVAEAADSERAAIRAKIDAAEPRIAAHMRELQSATKHFAVLKPKPTARTALIHAVAHERRDFSELRHAVSSSRASTPPAVGAQALVVSTLDLFDQSFAKLEQAARTHNSARSLRAVKTSRKLFDQAIQRSIDAQAALKQP